MRIKSWTLAAFVVCGVSSLAKGQDPLDENYGRAVHAFFRGDSLKTQELLDEVVGAGSQDPRVFYYRGLAASRNGNSDQATADFAEGARLEVAGKRVVNVGRSLERIQGPLRLELEKARLQARLDARSKILELDRARYDALQKSGGATEGGLVVPPSNGTPSPAPLAPNDPFLNGMTQGDATASPVTPVAPETTPAPESVDDAFGLEQPAADAVTPVEEEDAFGGDDAFGEAPAEEPALDTEEADPFGN